MTNAVRKTQCSGCQRYFTGTPAFDAHRIGPYTNRRCLTEEELRAKGFDSERRLVRSYQDGKPVSSEQMVWFNVAERERLTSRFRPLEEEEEESD